VTVQLLTANIGNPSADRARRQLDWLATRPEHVVALTETSPGRGSALLAEHFTAAGWQVAWQPPTEQGERGVLLAARVAAEPGGNAGRVDYLPARAASITLPTGIGSLEVVGLYVPSRDASEAKVLRKRRFCERTLTALAAASAHTVVLGDLNVLEPGHQPHYPFFQPFEYDFYRHLTGRLRLVDAFRHLHPNQVEHSWVGRTGDGYRYDHAFVSASLVDLLDTCAYVHEPRTLGLSDHAALSLTLRLAPPPLVGSNPATAAAAPTLF
jgi:exodeoxyribonuclease-3